MQRWAITRNAVKKRARVLNVELLRPDRRSCLWPGDALELAEQLHSHLQAGKPVATFPGLPAQPAEPVAALATVPTPGAKLALVAEPVTQPAALAALVAALRPPADPLAIPEAIARAADAGHWLTNKELAAVVGKAESTVRGWDAGQPLRPGYRLERQASERVVWWRIVREP